MKKLVLITLLFLISSPAMAVETIKISVNGLVCDFCARSIEKVFGKQEAVGRVTVDLTAKLITASMKDGQTLSDEMLTKLVTDAGFNITNIERENKDE